MATALDQSSIRWNHLIEDKLIYLNKLEKLISVHTDADCSSLSSAASDRFDAAEIGLRRPV
jgi:hypothetical protein